MKKTLLFQASSSSQKRDVTLLLLCPASCCRESVAGSVNSSSSSQSVSKALKLRQREREWVQVHVYGSIISLVCCIKAVQAQHLCQGCLMCSRVKVITTRLATEGQIFNSFNTSFKATDVIHSAIRGGWGTQTSSVHLTSYYLFIFSNVVLSSLKFYFCHISSYFVNLILLYESCFHFSCSSDYTEHLINPAQPKTFFFSHFVLLIIQQII